MTQLGIDYSDARPSPAAIRAAGYTFVIRYVTGEGKALTVAERDALWAEGLGIGLVFETTGTDAPGGALAGEADGAAAKAALDALGYPSGYPVFFATDFDEAAGSFAANAAYLQAASQACGRPAGPYGSLAVVNYMTTEGGCGYAWQSEAWSGTDVSPHANLYQRVTPTRSIAGSQPGDWDENVLIIPFPLWYPRRPAPAPVSQEEDMPQLRTGKGERDAFSFGTARPTAIRLVSDPGGDGLAQTQVRVALHGSVGGAAWMVYTVDLTPAEPAQTLSVAADFDGVLFSRLDAGGAVGVSFA